jgi:hypothetical protein
MRIQNAISHFNGLEFLLIQKPYLWQEIQTILSEAKSEQPLDEAFCASGWQRASADDQGWGSYLIKDRVALEFQETLPSSPEFYARHLAFYASDHIDVGIAILPVKSLQQMDSGAPAVPLVIVGVGI